MIKANFIDRLLDGAAVVFKPIGELAEIKRGSSITQKSVTPGEVPVIAGGRTPAYYHNMNNRSGQTIVIAGSGAYAGFVSWWEEPIFVSDAFTVKPFPSLLPKYCFYWLQGLQDEIHALKSGGGVPHVYPRDVSPLEIPVPCPENPQKSLEIQAEIVRILDNFTELTEELTAELTARKKQYNYYRDQLILNSGANSEKLKDISKIYLGLTYTPTYVEEGVKFISAQNTSSNHLDLTNVKYISIEEYEKSTSNAKPKRGDVLFTRVGSNLGHPVIVDTDEPLCMFVSLGFIRVNPQKVLSSYIKHWMNTDLFWDQVNKKTYGAAKINLNTGWLNEFDVLLPSITEQARIVAILDKFDALTNSLNEGLPREIALRQQQYEYYRDLLLRFPKPEQVLA